MDIFTDLIQGVQDDLTIGDDSSLFPLALVKRAINRAYRKSAGLFRWPELEDAQKTSTQTNQEYYDFPTNWQPDSMWRLEVDGDQYGETPDGSPQRFEDYLVWRADDDNANSTTKKWAVQHRRYFIYPVPTTAGDYNISVWGQRVPDALSNDADVTIWSYAMPECNEAVVLEAVAILKSKGEEDKSGEFKSTEAKQILVVAWGKIRQNQAKYEKTQPFFDVPDYFSGKTSAKQITGNFD